jgi:hypothetical protein
MRLVVTMQVRSPDEAEVLDVRSGNKKLNIRLRLLSWNLEESIVVCFLCTLLTTWNPWYFFCSLSF